MERNISDEKYHLLVVKTLEYFKSLVKTFDSGHKFKEENRQEVFTVLLTLRSMLVYTDVFLTSLTVQGAKGCSCTRQFWAIGACTG